MDTSLDPTLRLAQLEALVDELIKDQPEEKLIRSKMEENGLVYSEDPIKRIHQVLQALHFHESRKEFKE